MRLRIAIGVGLALVVAGSAAGAARPPTVNGSFSYYFWDHVTTVQLAAHGGSMPGGSLRAVNDYVDLTGDVRCVAVDGPVAWVAGAVTGGESLDQTGWAARVVDGGSAASGEDAAMFYLSSLEDVLAWCEARDMSWDEDAGPEPLSRGNLVVGGDRSVLP